MSEFMEWRKEDQNFIGAEAIRVIDDVMVVKAFWLNSTQVHTAVHTNRRFATWRSRDPAYVTCRNARINCNFSKTTNLIVTSFVLPDIKSIQRVVYLCAGGWCWG